MQDEPVWHCIIDSDGFQDGNKRYPINEDDLSEINEENFMRKVEADKCGHVPISDHINNEFCVIASETYLRQRRSIEIELSEFHSLLDVIRLSMRDIVNKVGGANE